MVDFPKWVPGGGVMVGGEEDGKTIKDLTLLVENAQEEKAVLGGTARLSASKSSDDNDIPNVLLCREPLPEPDRKPSWLSTRAQSRADEKADDLAEERAEDRAQAKRKR